MARNLKYPKKRLFRFSNDTDKLLVQRAKVMGITPAVYGRLIIEHSLTGKPFPKKASDV